MVVIRHIPCAHWLLGKQIAWQGTECYESIGKAAAQHSGPKADDASNVSLWLSFATFPAHTGSSESGSLGAVLNVTKAGAEHAAPESGSPVIEDFTKPVKTGTRSSATANRKLVMG